MTAIIKVNESKQAIDIYLNDDLVSSIIDFKANAIVYHNKLAELVNYGYELKFV